ncbi:Uncharacterized protein TCM_043246 [Theobroma cacao]|uniref:Uncharacterized protein n=1 Tax=Theobroma cacao TaxID=3641 RepID=A0A061FQ07_THECC|nr:Uncharacterized protein TCM_043246 [Theobroma cacao]
MYFLFSIYINWQWYVIMIHKSRDFPSFKNSYNYLSNRQKKMAGGVLFDIAGKVLEGLRPLALRELSLASNVKAELTKLERTVSIIKVVLLYAEE